MKYGIYSLFDIKSGAYAQPFYAPNRAVALRHLEAGREDENSLLSKFPGDFQLFELGTFNDEAGNIEVSTVPTLISGV